MDLDVVISVLFFIAMDHVWYCIWCALCYYQLHALCGMKRGRSDPQVRQYAAEEAGSSMPQVNVVGIILYCILLLCCDTRRLGAKASLRSLGLSFCSASNV